MDEENTAMRQEGMLDLQIIAMQMQRNKAEIERLTQQNKELSALLIGQPEQTWISDGVHYRVKVVEGRRMFRMDEEIFRLAVPEYSEWMMSVPDKARIQAAIDAGGFPNHNKWASFTKSAPYTYVKAEPVKDEEE